MEMTYDGTLVMPSSYAVMDEDEMMYLEGGAHIDWSMVGAICAVASLGIQATTYVKQYGVPKAITKIGGNIVAASNAVLRFVKNNIVGIIVGIIIGLGIAYLAPKFANAACKKVGVDITWSGATVSSY